MMPASLYCGVLRKKPSAGLQAVRSALEFMAHVSRALRRAGRSRSRGRREGDG
jgi:hypothetical protein